MAHERHAPLQARKNGTANAVTDAMMTDIKTSSSALVMLRFPVSRINLVACEVIFSVRKRFSSNHKTCSILRWLAQGLATTAKFTTLGKLGPKV